jgi:hypothetical protein
VEQVLAIQVAALELEISLARVNDSLAGGKREEAEGGGFAGLLVQW